ncbi:MAG TPA: BTAD domain-containing putative transcriptional regulator [Acidimicrobiales bacterium]|nr:BTAD domain-containing putative transcriptional regulator [Acidimicrobiales bacterium]
MECRVLGPIRVVAGDRVLHVPGHKERALLALLLLHRNTVVSTTLLIEEMWGPRWEASSSPAALRVHVSRLRKLLPPDPSGVSSIETHRRGYLLRLGGADYDAAQFETKLRRARALPSEACLEASSELADALGLWRGQPFEGAEGPLAILAEVARLTELRMSAVEARVEADLRCGRHEALAPELEALVRATPERERLWSAWMLAAYRCGRQAHALRIYQDLRAYLSETIGISPCRAVQDLERAILMQNPAIDPPAARASVALDRDRSREDRSSFVGRAFELQELRSMLQGRRLLTLTGPGGCGKSRLASQLLSSDGTAFEGETCVVDLSTAESPVAAVTAALALSDDAAITPTERIVRHLAPRRLLVLLDGCERAVQEIRPLVDSVLRECPLVTVVATSREPLHCAHETVWQVPPLDRREAIDLFVLRARAEGLDRARVDQICERLDGIPLAIELAASRAGTIPLEDLLLALNDRFQALANHRTTVERHRTLRGCIEWSYDLLDENPRRAFRRLGVFASPFSLESALALGVAVDDLSTLVEKSLVVSGGAAGGRFRLLDSLRVYALEALAEAGEMARTAQLHCDYFVSFAEQAAEQVEHVAQVEGLDRLSENLDEMRAAYSFSLECGDAEDAARLAVALRGLWLYRSRFREAKRWFDALDFGRLRDADPELAANALIVNARVEALLFGEAAGRLAEAAFEVGRQQQDERLEAEALTAAGMAVVYFGDGALGPVGAAIKLARACGDDRVLADALAVLALNHFLSGNAFAARPAAEEGVALARACDHDYLIRLHSFVLAASMMVSGDLTGGRLRISQVAEGAHAAGDLQFEMSALLVESMIASLRGDSDAARAAAARGLAVVRETGVAVYEGICAALVGVAAMANGELNAARVSLARGWDLLGGLLPAATALCSWGSAAVEIADGNVRAARLHARRLAEAYDTPTPSWYYALSLLAHAQVAVAEQDVDTAKPAARATLAAMHDAGMGIFVADAIDVLAAAGVLEGHHVEAAGLLGAAEAWRRRTGEVRFGLFAPAYNERVETLRTTLGEERLAAAWRALSSGRTLERLVSGRE